MGARWMARAERYRQLSEEFFNRGFYPEACFFAQQAAEFYLKGKLVELTGARPYTHSILHLLKLLAQAKEVQIDDALAKCAKYLTEQYIGSRYPDARMLDYDRDDAADKMFV
ncbi:MAG: HEPN domain-containing protein [Pyrobaculum sp.]